uniref:Uncharacterized protein n=1 Tax=Chaetoceros debilis TaxID=122233 RepID=A0A7S3QBV1_9STRA
MITSNQEKPTNICDDDIEANQTKSIKEDEDTEPPVNHSGHDHLQQDHLVITGIPLIGIDSKEEVGKCEEFESSAADSDLASRNLFLRNFTCGLMLGSFFVWPTIRICFFYLLTRCKTIGNLFFLEDKEQDPEMPNWLMALHYDPDRVSAVWRIIFIVETRVLNVMMMFLSLAIYLSKDGCLHKGKLLGVIYSPIVMHVVFRLEMVTTRSGHLRVE